MTKTFLQAEWRKLVMANFAVDHRILEKYLPFQTELDLWRNTCYVSLVGFMFLNTKIRGFKIPFHTNFEEVNLRFYVRYSDNGTWKRGVVFIKEIVPRKALTFIANTLYNEKYETMPMSHLWGTKDGKLEVAYKWKKARWNSISVSSGTQLNKIEVGSEEEFITEHYWGYTKIKSNVTSEYQVEHPRWEIYKTTDYFIDVDYENIYGSDFSFLKSENPKSVFIAEGSEIKVKVGKMIKNQFDNTNLL